MQQEMVDICAAHAPSSLADVRIACEIFGPQSLTYVSQVQKCRERVKMDP